MREKKPVIDKDLEALLQTLEKASYSEYMMTRVGDRVRELRSGGVHGLDKFMRKLSDRAAGKESYLDILMEGRFAVILARNGFSEICLEVYQDGPDIKADYIGQTLFFEVTRRRPSGDEWANHNDATFTAQDSVENVLGKIQGKVTQLIDDEINIVVLWSDTVRLMSPNIKEAMEYIAQETRANPNMYRDLSAVLFTEGGGFDTATLQQFYLFRNDAASKPLSSSLATKLKSLHEQEPEKWRRDINEMYTSLRRMTELKDSNRRI